MARGVKQTIVFLFNDSEQTTQHAQTSHTLSPRRDTRSICPKFNEFHAQSTRPITTRHALSHFANPRLWQSCLRSCTADPMSEACHARITLRSAGGWEGEGRRWREGVETAMCPDEQWLVEKNQNSSTMPETHLCNQPCSPTHDRPPKFGRLPPLHACVSVTTAPARHYAPALTLSSACANIGNMELPRAASTTDQSSTSTHEWTSPRGFLFLPLVLLRRPPQKPCNRGPRQCVCLLASWNAC